MSDVADHSLQRPRGGSELSVLRQELAHLQGKQGNRFEPVRFHMIESLLRRAAGKSEEVTNQLLDKARLLLAQYKADWQQARAEADQVLDAFQGDHTVLARLYETGDFHGVLSQAGRLQRLAARSPLSDLLSALVERSRQEVTTEEPLTFEGLLRKQEVDALKQVEDDVAIAELDALLPVGELKALQDIRETWAKRSTEKAVAKALDEAPEDAGPLNAHRLVVRSLMAMQEVSPEYLGRFVNQIETLLWLEQAGARLLGKQDKNAEGKPKAGTRQRR